MRSLVFLLFLLILTPVSYSGTVSESVKRFIYEIRNPAGKRGTGFVISDSLLGKLLVTCQHVVQDSGGSYVDSIYVRRNKLLSTGQAISDTSEFVLRLKVNGRRYFVKHPNQDVDLIIIPFLHDNTTMPRGESLPGLYSRTVLTKERIEELGIDEGTDVELIGFSLSSSLSKDSTHFHFSRFGKVGLYTTKEFTLVIDGKARNANFILLDMITRPGESGSPIFGHIGEKTYLIGFISARSKVLEYGIGYPVYYLYDLMELVKKKIGRQ